MKLAVGFLLVFFVIYLSTPSIVSIIDIANDLTIDFGTIDEDQSDVLKISFKSVPFVCFSEAATGDTGKIFYAKILKHSLLSHSIFIPPPDRV